MKVRTIEFEGTADEFRTVADLFAGTKVADAPEDLPVGDDVQNADVSAELYIKALMRLPLSDNQKAVISSIVDAGDDGINSDDLANAVGLSRQQIAGVMGTLGRRAARTPNWPENTFFFNFNRVSEGWLYKAPGGLREAVTKGVLNG